ncbi:MAG: FGGY-family carbohydrate kinase [Opitutae bacterium]|nr:FGGY-family carbohydrate kinase [Opitutae bacterium]
MAYSLGIDGSTQSMSAIVIDLDKGDVVCECAINFGERLPQYNSPNGFFNGESSNEVYSDPLMWLDAIDLLFEELKELCDLSKVEAISGAGQQHGSVYLNAQWLKAISHLDSEKTLSKQIKPCLSRPHSPIWMDTSTTLECQEITQALGGNDIICQKSGSVAIERFTGPQIRRFYKTSLEAYPNTARIHLVSSFLCSIFSGQDAPIDTGDGAGMNLMNLKSNTWDDDLVHATAPNLLDKLPDIVQGETIVGKISDYFVKKYGFSEKVSVVVFTGDNPSSLVGTAASTPSKTVISLGTSDTFFAAMPSTVSDPNGFGHVFGNPSGGSMSLQCFLNGSLAREYVKDKYEYSWDQFTDALSETPPGCNGNYMLPFFSPEISPLYNGNGPVLKGTSIFENWRSPKLAIRACIEGQFMNMKVHTDWMQMVPEIIYVTGGASKNTTIIQILSDIFQADVQRLEVSGSVALGGAIRAAQHCLNHSLESLEASFCSNSSEVIKPNESHKELYTKAIEEIESMLLVL